MAQTSSPRRATSLHRLLIGRLATMTALICLAMAGLAYWRDLDRYDEAILRIAMRGAEDFRRDILAELDRRVGLDSRKVQAVLDDMAARSPGEATPLGRVVSVRITGADQATIAMRSAKTHPQAEEAEQFLARQSASANGGLTFRRVVRIGDRPHLHLGMDLTDSTGNPAAHAQAVYAVSDQVLEDIAKGTARTIGLVVLVVLSTTLLLYPVILRLLRHVAGLTAHVQQANLEILSVLGGAIAKRDSDTDQHNDRVTIYSVRLAEELGWDDAAIRGLIKGALLHDVGKIGIRDAVLLKPGRLTPEEFAEMRRHVQHGRDIVARAHWLEDALPVIGGHHEKFDGAGYDSGLCGAEIPAAARLFAIVDVFDALTSRRPYKEPLGFGESMALLEKGRGAHFDPDMLDAFARIAEALYGRITASPAESLRSELDSLFQRYFSGDVSEMMRQAEAFAVRGRLRNARSQPPPGKGTH